MTSTTILVTIDRKAKHLRLIIDIPTEQSESVNEALAQLQADQREIGSIIVESLLTASEQAYFWTPAWQAKEQQADADLAEGHFKTFDTMDDMLAFLDQQ
jgi:hypothetical protein